MTSSVWLLPGHDVRSIKACLRQYLCRSSWSIRYSIDLNSDEGICGRTYPFIMLRHPTIRL